jgi:hypothetical protein
MPAARLSDSQKAEVVERFRAGEGLQPLADAYGCSPNTVSRVVKAALDPGEYERLKEQRNRRSASPKEPLDPSESPSPSAALAPATDQPEPAAALAEDGGRPLASASVIATPSDPADADASIEVRAPVVYATFVLVFAIAPVLFLTGLQGAFFAPLALAFILAVLASLLVALTMVPALSLLLLQPRPCRRDPGTRPDHPAPVLSRVHSASSGDLSPVCSRRSIGWLPLRL